jgi:GTP cyclohydrolase I
MMTEMMTPEEFNFTTFPSTSDEMVTMGPIPFYTLCSHHVVPFFGNVWVGYVPNKDIAGLSKIPRLVKYIAKGLHVQEELTGAIAVGLETHLNPKGVAVVLKAEHLCMAMRGVKQPGVITTTAKMTGVFALHDRTAKVEFMEWIRNG